MGVRIRDPWGHIDPLHKIPFKRARSREQKGSPYYYLGALSRDALSRLRRKGCFDVGAGGRGARVLDVFAGPTDGTWKKGLKYLKGQWL